MSNDQSSTISEEEVEISGFIIIMDLFDIVVGSNFFFLFLRNIGSRVLVVKFLPLKVLT